MAGGSCGKRAAHGFGYIVVGTCVIRHAKGLNDTSF